VKNANERPLLLKRKKDPRTEKFWAKSMKNQCCKTCNHWDRASAEDAAGRVRPDRVARCEWTRHKVESLDAILPMWLSKEVLVDWAGRPYTGATDGAECRGWEARN